MKRLIHITDVGAPSGNGIDSTQRIESQYKALGFSADIVTAGHSPLAVAFTACTTLSAQARENTRRLLERLGQEPPPLPPVALNCAPRNSTQSNANGKEDYIYRVRSDYTNVETLLLYGPEVLQWVLAFRGRVGVTVEKILAIPGIIPDTSTGSQFRSAEHLPIAHVLETMELLDKYSEREGVRLDDIQDLSPKNNEVVCLPPDEFGNGRLLVLADRLAEILKRSSIGLDGLYDDLAVRRSLTEVDPGELSMWPSSNHFPNPKLAVANIGTRWSPGQTRTTDTVVTKLSERLSKEVGTRYPVLL